MSKLLWKFVIILVITGIFVYSTGLMYISSHEAVHQQIYRHYGIESEVEINYFLLYGVTKPNADQFFESCDDYCNLAHRQTDIVGYHINYIVFSVWTMFILFIITKFVLIADTNC